MNALEATSKHTQKIERSKGLKKTERFLSPISLLNISDPENLIELLQNNSTEQVLQLITKINAYLRDKPVAEVQSYDDIRTAYVPESIIPSSDSKQFFKDFIETTINGMTKENQPSSLVKLYAMIILCHVMPDANGRTARYLYQKLRFGTVDSQTIEKRNYNIYQLSTTIFDLGMIALYSDLKLITDISEGTQIFADLRREPRKYMNQHYDRENSVELSGPSAPLMFLAIVYKQKGNFNLAEDEKISATPEELESREFKQAYDVIYKDYLGATLQSIDTNATGLVSMFDNAFQNPED